MFSSYYAQFELKKGSACRNVIYSVKNADNIANKN